jgi:hypothetical protein
MVDVDIVITFVYSGRQLEAKLNFYSELAENFSELKKHLMN